MAVTLSPSDLIYPTGMLQAVQFTDNDLLSNVTIWLNQAKVEPAIVALPAVADANQAARHYVYARGYGAIADRIAARPNQERTKGDLERTWAGDRVAYYAKLSKEHAEAYQEMVKTRPVSNERFSSDAQTTAVW